MSAWLASKLPRRTRRRWTSECAAPLRLSAVVCTACRPSGKKRTRQPNKHGGCPCMIRHCSDCTRRAPVGHSEEGFILLCCIFSDDDVAFPLRLGVGRSAVASQAKSPGKVTSLDARCTPPPKRFSRQRRTVYRIPRTVRVRWGNKRGASGPVGQSHNQPSLPSQFSHGLQAVPSSFPAHLFNQLDSLCSRGGVHALCSNGWLRALSRLGGD